MSDSTVRRRNQHGSLHRTRTLTGPMGNQYTAQTVSDNNGDSWQAAIASSNVSIHSDAMGAFHSPRSTRRAENLSVVGGNPGSSGRAIDALDPALMTRRAADRMAGDGTIVPGLCRPGQ